MAKRRLNPKGGRNPATSEEMYELRRKLYGLPNRNDLPQEGPEQSYTVLPTGNIISDTRSIERRTFDQQLADLTGKIKAEDDRKGKRTAAAAEALGRFRGAGRRVDVAGDDEKEPPEPVDSTPKQTDAPLVVDGNTGPKNGTPQAPVNSSGSRPDPIRPRGVAGQPPAAVYGSDSNRYGDRAGDSGVTVNGARVRVGNNRALNHIDESQAEATATDAINAAEARRDAQQRARQNIRDRAAADMEKTHEQNMRIYEFNKKAEADRARMIQERKDKRFADRTLSNMDDWRNLGREGGNTRNYAAAANETPEQKAEREAALAARNKTLAGLKDRLARMSDATLVKNGEKYEWKDGKAVVTDAAGKPVDTADRKTTGVGDDGLSYGNNFYANNPNRVKNLQAISKLVEEAGDNITDAQMEALTKKLDSWQKEADTRGANVAAMQEMRDAERISGLRQKYGLTDKAAFADSDVTAYHDRMQKAARTDILKGMQVAPGLDATSMKEGKGAASMRAFSESWQKLLDNGFSPEKTFAAAMGNADTKKAYQDALASLGTEGPDVADKRDQLRRRFIMQQAMQEHGLTGTGGEAGAAGAQIAAKPGVEGIPGSGQTMAQAMAQNLPGSSVLTPAGKTAYETARAAAQPALDAMNQQKPQAQNSPLAPKKKPEDGAAAAMLAGETTLRPRRRV